VIVVAESPASVDPGALLARSWRLDSGLRVRLRVARPRDAAAVRDLLERCGVAVAEIEVERLVRPDPRRELTICATAPLGGREELVGIGAVSFDDGAPHTVTCDARMDADGARLVDAALRELVRRRARRAA
jgi:hypothetical protein